MAIVFECGVCAPTPIPNKMVGMLPWIISGGGPNGNKDDYVLQRKGNDEIIGGQIYGEDCIKEDVSLFTQHKMNMDEAIQVSFIIDKLSPSWKDFKHTLKHNKEELTLVELGSHLRIRSSIRLNIVNDIGNSTFMSTFKLNDSILWHARLGHVHFKRMQDMSKDGLIPAFDMDTEKTRDEDVALWKEANNDEMDSIMGNNTLVLADLPLGTKQWHQKFDEVVLSNGYLLNQAEKYVYSKFCMNMEFLSSKFSMKDMREADVILSIRTKHESNGIAISQSHYIKKVLKKFNYFDCTLVSTPMDTSEKLMPNNGEAVSQLEYSMVIGCLMYAMTCTRPDIAFVVGNLSSYTSNPGTQHWQAIQRISNTEDNSSTSGWVFLLGGGAIYWASKKQTCITGLIIESKFVALVAACEEAEWLRNLIHETPLGSKPIAPISILCDSAATLAKAYSQMYNGKSRHLGVRHNMICELITNGVVSIEFVRSQRNLVDHLTKRLTRETWF
ncbi:zinc finger, CCHC-type containing protein [Tanacetum coccineum]